MSTVGLTHLRSFVAVAEAGSITGAGRALYLTQPAVTRQIAALERTTGLQLLRRTSQGVALTEDGARFLRGAQRVLSTYDRLLDTDTRTAAPPRGGQAEPSPDEDEPVPAAAVVMRLGIEADAPSEATQAVRSFAVHRPGSSWRITRAHEQDLKAMLRSGHLDAAVVWVPPEDRALSSIVVGRVELLVAMPRALADEHPGPVPPSIWTQLPVAMWDRSEGELEYDHWTLLLGRAGPVTTLSVPQLDNAQDQMLAAVARGGAVCFVTASHWEQHRTPGVDVRPLDPPLVVPLHLLWASARPDAWVADLISPF